MEQSTEGTFNVSEVINPPLPTTKKRRQKSAQSVRYPEFTSFHSVRKSARTSNGSSRHQNAHKKKRSCNLFLKWWALEDCLGFPTRSQSFAFVALPQYAQSVRYPEFTSFHSVRKSARTSNGSSRHQNAHKKKEV